MPFLGGVMIGSVILEPPDRFPMSSYAQFFIPVGSRERGPSTSGLNDFHLDPLGGTAAPRRLLVLDFGQELWFEIRE